MKDNLVETLVGFGVIVVAAIFVFYGYSVTDPPAATAMSYRRNLTA